MYIDKCVYITTHRHHVSIHGYVHYFLFLFVVIIPHAQGPEACQFVRSQMLCPIPEEKRDAALQAMLGAAKAIGTITVNILEMCI